MLTALQIQRFHDACRVVLQVLVSPKSNQTVPSHFRLSLPSCAIAAAYEPSTPVLLFMIAELGDVEALGLYCFDFKFKQLQKQGQIDVPARIRFSEHRTLASLIPRVLFPSCGASDAAAAAKVIVICYFYEPPTY